MSKTLALAIVVAIACSATGAFAAGPPVASQSQLFVVIPPGHIPALRWGDICPAGDAGSMSSQQYVLTAILRDAQGLACAGIPASDIEFRSPSLYLCPGAANPSGPSDPTGKVEWTAPIRGGGCTQQVEVLVAGVSMGLVQYQLHSVDMAGSPSGADGAVDVSDLSFLASSLGVPAMYSECLDWNESHVSAPLPRVIDASDLSYFASHLRHRCP
jgi:hypothetical protein